MLKCITVIIYVIIVIVRISKEISAPAKHITGTDISLWKKSISGVFNFKHLFTVVIKRFSGLISQVSIGIAIANDLYSIVYPDRSMVSSNNNIVFLFGEILEDVQQRTVTEP